MTGQIPPYGKYFTRIRVRFAPGQAHRVYALKRDRSWFIRSDSTSERWQVYHGDPQSEHTAMGTPLPTFTAAMARLLDGITQGFYATSEQETIQQEQDRLWRLRDDLCSGCREPEHDVCGGPDGLDPACTCCQDTAAEQEK